MVRRKKFYITFKPDHVFEKRYVVVLSYTIEEARWVAEKYFPQIHRAVFRSIDERVYPNGKILTIRYNRPKKKEE